MPIRYAFAFAVCLAAVPAVTHAHFKLVEPASWIVEDDRGDPQKGFPCGGSNTDYGKPSYAVSQAIGGSKLHLKVQETIYHPGHYRVALAVNSPAELPVDPKATTEDGPKGPAVGVGRDHESGAGAGPRRRSVPASARSTTPLETDVTAAEHQLQAMHAPGDPVHGAARAEQSRAYTYHHCATIQITADPKKPIDAAWPKERVETMR